MRQTQVVKHLFAPTNNDKTQAPGKTGAVTGSVVDDQGHPISGAKVWGGFGQQPFAQDTTDQSGQFALDKIAAPAFVTVTADGYAADQQAFDPTNVPGPLLFRLSPVRSAEGAPGGRIWPGSGRSAPVSTTMVGQSGDPWPVSSTADGCGWPVAMAFPSQGRVGVDICQDRLPLILAQTSFAADGELHTIVLHPRLRRVTGSVTDAETGTPVASFKLTLGHSQPWVPADPVPMWDMQSQSRQQRVLQGSH